MERRLDPSGRTNPFAGAIDVIEAPVHLGLSRHPDRSEGRHDELLLALRAGGLDHRRGVARVSWVSRADYPTGRVYDEGTLNALAIRPFLLALAGTIGDSLDSRQFALVVRGTGASSWRRGLPSLAVGNMD